MVESNLINRAASGASLPEWCRTLMPGEWAKIGPLWVGLVTVTPESAALLLARHNACNRPITPSRVSTLVEALAAGRWMLTGETLIFDTSGNAQSAQHRLTACVDSGVPLQSYAVWGVSPAVFAVVDCVLPKVPASRLAAMHEENYSTLAGATVIINCFLASGRIARPAVSMQVGSFDSIRTTLDRFPDIRQSVSFGKTARGRGFGGPSVSAALHWILGRSSPEARATAELMITCVTNRCTSPLWPDVNMLTNRLDPSSRISTNLPMRAALSVRAFNAYMGGRPLRILRWVPETEPFPRVHGWKYGDDGIPMPA